jgi:hypothetical protein
MMRAGVVLYERGVSHHVHSSRCLTVWVFSCRANALRSEKCRIVGIREAGSDTWTRSFTSLLVQHVIADTRPAVSASSVAATSGYVDRDSALLQLVSRLARLPFSLQTLL